MPEVTVIIPAYNCGRTIEAALESVFAQTFTDLEVVVVDDNSTDDTASRIASFRPRVRSCRETGGGIVRALNAGLLRATAPVVAVLEPTSTWSPRKLDRQLRYLNAHPGTAFLHAETVTSDAAGIARLCSADEVPIDEPSDPPSAAGPVAVGAHVHASTVVFKRDVVAAIGAFDPAVSLNESVRDFASRIAAVGAIGYQNIPVAVDRPEAVAAPAPAAARPRQRNLLHDTAFRRARARATAAIHAVDDTLSARGRRARRVLFEAASPMSLAVFAPVLRQLWNDPRLELWFTSCDTSWTPEAIFGAAGITERVVRPHEVRWVKFDGYINTDFWDMTWLPRRTRRMHFFHGVAGKYGLDAPVRIAPIVATFDRLMFPNRDRLRRYAEAGLIDADSPQAALIGYPKVDCLVDGSLNRSDTLRRAGADRSAPTVLYAPTWSPYSSLNTIGLEVISALGGLGLNVIVKLHDRSYDRTRRGSGGVDWRRSLQHECERHGARLVEDADASPWLHAADLLVTDHSSVGFEFMLLDRPIVVLDCPELIAKARVNPDKVSTLRSAAEVVRGANDLAFAVTAALDNPGEHRTERRRIADELFYCPGSATSRAVQSIYELLAIAQPAVHPANAPAAAVAGLAPLVRSF